MQRVQKNNLIPISLHFLNQLTRPLGLKEEAQIKKYDEIALPLFSPKSGHKNLLVENLL